jgi:hypothetical protein
MTIKATVVAVGAALLTSAAQLHAHHSFAAQYDANKPITLTGKVTKVEWMNPHVYFHIDVKDDKGTVVTWACEMGGGPNSLIRQGWTKDSLKPDDTVTVEGFLAKDGSKLASARNVTLTSTGKKMFAGTNEEKP